jgi:hypothetical protein
MQKNYRTKILERSQKDLDEEVHALPDRQCQI